jgi:hypothetical protein
MTVVLNMTDAAEGFFHHSALSLSILPAQSVCCIPSIGWPSLALLLLFTLLVEHAGEFLTRSCGS